MDLRDLVRAVLRYDTLTARQWLADAERAGFRWADVPVPQGLDPTASALVAGITELMASRSGQASPAWTSQVPAAPERVFLVRAAATMPRLRDVCEREGPEPPSSPRSPGSSRVSDDRLRQGQSCLNPSSMPQAISPVAWPARLVRHSDDHDLVGAREKDNVVRETGEEESAHLWATARNTRSAEQAGCEIRDCGMDGCLEFTTQTAALASRFAELLVQPSLDDIPVQ